METAEDEDANYSEYVKMPMSIVKLSSQLLSESSDAIDIAEWGIGEDQTAVFSIFKAKYVQLIS